MNKTDIINLIARRIQARTYLEIGAKQPTANFNWIDAPDKTWIDLEGPDNDKRGQRVTTGEYFEAIGDHRFDLILANGDRRYQGAKYDIHHAMKHLSPGGVLVIGAVLPVSAAEGVAVRPDGDRKIWCGEVWRAWCEVREWSYSNGFVTFAVDCDHGVGVVYDDPDHWRDSGGAGEDLESVDVVPPWRDRSTYGVVPPASAEREINQIPRTSWERDPSTEANPHE